ncbi:MAG: DUF4198 domain-containing protein [Planctomycetaceae bacterium]
MPPSIRLVLALCAAAAAARAHAHDTWVQVSAPVVRPGDLVHVDLALGNHGNDHRDFKFAGKLRSLDGATLTVLAPDGRATDLVPAAIDLGSAPTDGFWSARHVPAVERLHCVAHTREGRHRDTRSIKSAKTYFVVAEDVTRPSAAARDLPAPLGHALELVPETHPVLDAGPGRAIAVRLLFRGRPLADERVSFIPRGTELAADFDPDFERRTDAEGRCTWTPKQGDRVLVVARRAAPEERGTDHEGTAYSATLVIDVPQRRPCGTID